MAELKAKDFEDLIKKVNPFGLRTEDGAACTFENYGQCYYFVLKCLRAWFHKGFIDMPLALHKLTQMPIQDARRIAKKFPFISLHNEIYLCGWEDRNSNPKHRAEMIIRSLHTLSDTKFSTDFYYWAWDKFCKEENITP